MINRINTSSPDMKRARSYGLVAIMLFFLGVVTVSSVGLQKVKSWFSFAATQTLNQMWVYDDSLQNTFHLTEQPGNPPSHCVVTYSNPDHASGQYSMELNLNHFCTSIFTKQNDTTFPASNYTNVEFDMKGETPLFTTFNVSLNNTHYSAVGTDVSIGGQDSQYQITNNWQHIVIPLDSFNLEPNAQITGLSFRSDDNPNPNLGNVLIDNVQFIQVQDVTPPTLTGLRNTDLTHLILTFNERVQASDVQNAANFTITSPDDPNYSSAQTVSQSSLDDSQKNATLVVPDTTTRRFQDTKHYIVHVSNIRDIAGNTIASNSQQTVQIVVQTGSLSVYVNRPVHPFSPLMHGADLATWMHAANTGKPYPGDIPVMTELAKQAKIKFWRNGGGNWANSMVWDRSNQLRQWSDYIHYNYYNAAMMDSLARLKQDTGADVLIQVNVCGVDSSMLQVLGQRAYNDPNKYPTNEAMWQDFFKYVNVEKHYGFHYVELGSENNYDDCYALGGRKLTVDELTNNVMSMRAALLSVDSSLKFISPATAGYGGNAEHPGVQDPNQGGPDWFMPIIDAFHQTGHNLDGLAWHNYQSNEGFTGDYCTTHEYGPTYQVLFNYNTIIVNDPTNCQGSANDIIPDDNWLISHRRRYLEVANDWSINRFLVPHNSASTMTGITELNTLAGSGTNPMEGNYIAALWFSDILGRMGHAKYDFNTMYDWYDGSNDVQADSYYGVTYPDADLSPTHIYIRPTYYTYLLYGRYFGDMVVDSATSDPKQNLSVWASTDSQDPNKVKLIVTNLSESYVSATVNVSGFTTVDGMYYELDNPNPLSVNRTSAQNGGGSTINGLTIDTSSVSSVQTSVANIDTHPQRLTSIQQGGFVHGFPGYSSTAIILSNSPLPSMSPPPPTSTPAPSVSPTVAPTAVPTSMPRPTPTPTMGPAPTVPAGGTRVTFDNYPNSNVSLYTGDLNLTNQYPAGVINWGSTATWITSSPYAGFTNSRSLTFKGGSRKQSTFTILNGSKVVSIDASDPYGSTVTLSCTGNPTISFQVPANRNGVSTIYTRWVNPCASAVTLKSSGGDTTNFDNLVLQ